ncbi:MAG: S-methyl-5'-thioadenosine phosphorylase [Candidatus Aenigmarchaeota archaeon]|nr:S-methyl-5'-thioadenosine phosphorylase [Candidatus Aenigmarchaeota archaeon]
MEEKAEIGIIGGTGVYEFLKDSKEIKVYTPFGEPSDLIGIGIFKGRKIAFIPRHGKGHRIPPNKINSRANIWAFKELGVKRIVAPAAVGSLRENIKPGDIVIPNQFIDRTYRVSSFYEGGKVCHISTADPFCPQLIDVVSKTCKELNFPFHTPATYVCVEGPRFSTRAESKLYREWGADIIGMTLLPECVLAREAEICYVCIGTVTDYDVWAEKPVSTEEVIRTLKENINKTRKLLEELLPKIPLERNCKCKDALKDAFI